MKTLDEIKSIIRENLSYLRADYNVQTIEIFGSYTKNLQSSQSDVDLLVTFSKAPSLLKYIALENYLSRILGLQVDLVMKKSLKPILREYILNDIQPI
jgi:predicted nucleotidyltransferase